MRRGYVALDLDEDVEQIACAQDLSPDSIEVDCTTTERRGQWRAARLLARAAPSIGGPLGINLLAAVSAGLTNEERNAAAARLGLFDNPQAAIRYQDARARSLTRLLRSVRPSIAVGFDRGDTILVPGIIWSETALTELRRLKRERGVRIIAYVHDLIPVRRPEFHPDETGVRRFRRYIETMVAICERICVSSEFVAADLRAFARDYGRPGLSVVRVPLGPGISRATPRHCTPRLAALRLEGSPFALFVSTINTRKNHAGLYEIWRRLAQSPPSDRCPRLVLAGQRGWGANDLLRQMERDRETWGHAITLVEAPTDAELSYLYDKCLFTVFPSHYEGWGLGVTESLEMGKPCIAADNTALREAGQGLAVHIDTLDGPRWLETIHLMTEDNDFRRDAIERIRCAYRPRTWCDVGEEIMSAVSGSDAEATAA